ncbi:hypothetical protein, partial [Oceanithermus sp.]
MKKNTNKHSGFSKYAMVLAAGSLLMVLGLSLAQGGPPANRGYSTAATATTQLSEEAKEALLEALTGPEG